MKIELAISDYLHALTTLRLAAALDNRSVYVKQVAKRLSKRVKAKEARKICKSISKSEMPSAVVQKFLNQIELAYHEQGYDWKEQA